MSDSLRVLITPSIFPPESGGPATFAPDIGRALHDRGHEVAVVTNGSVEASFDNRYPFDVTRVVRAGPKPLQYARQVLTILQVIRSFEPDVVLSNGSDFQPVLAAGLSRTPIVSKIVGDGAWERAQRRAGVTDDIESFQWREYGPSVRLYKAIRNFEIRQVDQVVVPSTYLQKLAISWGKSQENTRVIYNALDLDVERPAPEERAPDVLTVARLVEWKGIEGVIDAFERVGDTRSEARLHIVGDGRHREALERYASNTSVAERIEFHGRVTHDRVLELMQRSRVFALNSAYEGLPHVVLEAMACGVPPVVSDAGGSPEAVVEGTSGFVIEQDDVQALAERFHALLEDNELVAEMQEGGKHLLSCRFDHDEMVDEYVSVLRQVANY